MPSPLMSAAGELGTALGLARFPPRQLDLYAGPKKAARKGQLPMPCRCQPILFHACVATDSLVAAEDPGGGLIAETPSQYRPRHPEKTARYRLFQDHFDSYVQAYEERFEPRSGPLRPVVVRTDEPERRPTRPSG